MKTFSLLALSTLCAAQAWSGVIANSVADFSGVQGQGGLFYGFFNQTANGAYSTANFVEFANFVGGVWRPSDAQVGAQNNLFWNSSSQGGHPAGIGPSTQDAAIWAMRRFVSTVCGNIVIAYDLGKLNVSEPNGGGITGRIFLDGVPVFAQFIANLDGAGVQGVLNLSVDVGSKIHFAIDPLGVAGGSGDNPLSARADGSRFTAVISTAEVPEPTTGLLACAALAGFGIKKLYSGRAPVFN